VPTARAGGGEPLVITIDTRERYPYKFAGRAVESRRSALASGDYAVLDGERVLAAVERKTLEDLVKSLIDGKLGFQLAEDWTHRFLAAAAAHHRADEP
jgi:ERCC4-type nuclease